MPWSARTLTGSRWARRPAAMLAQPVLWRAPRTMSRSPARTAVREQQVVDGDGLQLAVLLTAVADVVAAVHHRALVPRAGLAAVRPASHNSLKSGQAQTRSSTEHSGALPFHGLRAAILFHPRSACLYRRATISSSIRAVIEVRWEPPPSTWAVTVTTASLSGEIMQSWP